MRVILPRNQQQDVVRSQSLEPRPNVLIVQLHRHDMHVFLCVRLQLAFLSAHPRSPTQVSLKWVAGDFAYGASQRSQSLRHKRSITSKARAKSCFGRDPQVPAFQTRNLSYLSCRGQKGDHPHALIEMVVCSILVVLREPHLNALKVKLHPLFEGQFQRTVLLSLVCCHKFYAVENYAHAKSLRHSQSIQYLNDGLPCQKK